MNDDRSIMFFIVAFALLASLLGGIMIYVITRNDDLPPGM